METQPSQTTPETALGQRGDSSWAKAGLWAWVLRTPVPAFTRLWSQVPMWEPHLETTKVSQVWGRWHNK